MNNKTIREEVKQVYTECFICNNGHETRLNKTWYKMLTLHHILPRSRGGSDSHSNLICLCRGCHDAYHEYLSKLHIHLKTWPEFYQSLINFKLLTDKMNEIDRLLNKYDANKDESILREVYNLMANNVYRIIDTIPDDIDPSDIYDIYLKLIRISRVIVRHPFYRFGYMLDYSKSDQGLSSFVKSNHEKVFK